MKKHERMAALVVLIVGCIVAYHSATALKIGSLQRPDSGFFPFIASAGMALSGGWLALASLGQDPNPSPFWEERAWMRPALAALFLLLYALGFEPVGYVISTFLLMVLWQWVIERVGWGRVLVMSLASTTIMWFLFEKLLGVPLPGGFLAA
ncbi:MAG TPA: tripartite tricarboxylate transporter TctB family protein [Symbiobacteriaceae bacterium]